MSADSAGDGVESSDPMDRDVYDGDVNIVDDHVNVVDSGENVVEGGDVVDDARPLDGEDANDESFIAESAYESAVQDGLPLVIPVELTGETRVDAALERLAELDDVPVAEHVEVFADIHARLTGALADLGEGA